jgi:DNA-binding winged helix-turn-helix (wHTH) protein/tetratricopeptide (TPR) repeat protein
MGNLYSFGPFILDPRRRTLTRADSPVSLTPKAFDVLLFLAQHPNRLVTKEELLQAVWGSTFVEEGNLTQYISLLRKALDDGCDDARLIVTIARKGYQFTARVTVIADSADAPRLALPSAATAETRKTGTPPPDVPPEAKVAESPRWRRWFAAAALSAVIVATFWLYSIYRHRVTLLATDTVVLADITNETSDPVFDDALATALRYEMEQTPYLNILDGDKVLGALAELKLPPATKLTPDVARQVCLRTNSELVIATSIADAGNGFRIGLDASDCQSGKIVAGIRDEVADQNQVVHMLGVASAQLRRKLGEPAESLARFNQPLDEALSPSVEALQVEALGFKHHTAGDVEGAVPYYHRALELDPNFALSYDRLGAAYLFVGNTELSEASYTREYQLRDRLTEKNRLAAEINYYSYVIGDWEKEYSSALRLLETFPRDVFAHTSLRSAFVYLGQPGRAADEAAETAQLRPTPYYFGSAIQSIRFASRFNEANSWLARADALKLDSSLIRRERLIVAFATGDQDGVEKTLRNEEQGRYRKDFLHEHSLIEIQRGRFNSAEHLRLQASAGEPNPSGGDWWAILSALEDAEVGKEMEARRYESKTAGTPLDSDGEVALALALARSGQTAEAGKLADEVSKEKPEDTLVQHYFIPTIRAAIKLQQHDPAAAIDLLSGTAKYDLAFTGSFNYVYPAYIRGLAYLELGDGQSAATQFQKLIDNPGFTVRHVTGPLAWLQLGRAQNMMGDQAAARKSYETFLNLWKSADPDIPIYRQAKTEYAKLK